MPCTYYFGETFLEKEIDYSLAFFGANRIDNSLWRVNFIASHASAFYIDIADGETLRLGNNKFKLYYDKNWSITRYFDYNRYLFKELKAVKFLNISKDSIEVEYVLSDK